MDKIAIGVVRFLIGFVLAYVFLRVAFDASQDLAAATGWVCGTVWQLT